MGKVEENPPICPKHDWPMRHYRRKDGREIWRCLKCMREKRPRESKLPDVEKAVLTLEGVSIITNDKIAFQLRRVADHLRYTHKL